MNVVRRCSVCRAKLASDNLDDLCSACQRSQNEDKRAELENLHYTVRDIRQLLGLLNDEDVRRKSRRGEIPGRVPGRRSHLFFRHVIDRWLKSGLVPIDDGGASQQGTKDMKAVAKTHSNNDMPSLQPVLIIEGEPPAFCLVSPVSQTDEVHGTLDGKALHVLRAKALIDNQEVAVIYDSERGCWRKE